MPKSKNRKDRKPYRRKHGPASYVSDPMTTLVQLGRGELGDDEATAASLLLFESMTAGDEASQAVMADAFGELWPPQTPDDIKKIATAYVAQMEEILSAPDS